MAPTPRPTGSQTAAVTPAAGSDLMPPPPPRTPAAAALPRRGVVRQPPAVTPDVATTPVPSPATTPAAPTDALPPPPALTSAPAPRGVKRPRAADASSGRKRPRAVTPRDRFVGARLDDAGEAYRAHTALALAPKTGTQPVLNASLRSSLLSPRTGTRFLSVGGGSSRTTISDASARSIAEASATATRWRETKPFRVLDAPDIADDFYSTLLDWSPHGDKLVVVLEDIAYLASARNDDKTPVRGLKFGSVVTAVTWALGGAHVAVGTINGLMQIVDVETGRCVRNIGVHDGRIGTLHWNPVTRCLTSGSHDNCICDYDLRTPEVATTWRLGHDDAVCGVRWRDDGRLLASGGNDNAVLLWDARRASPYVSITRAHRAAVKALAWCPTRHDVLASGGGAADKRVRLWNSVTGASLASCDAGAQVTGLAWAPNGTPEVVASLGGREETAGAGISAFRWSRAVNRLDCVATMDSQKWHEARIVGLATSPDRTRFAFASADEILSVWDLYDAPGGTRSAFSAVQRRGDVRRWDDVLGQVLR